jgi:predicted RNA-binding protein with PUA-like domain
MISRRFWLFKSEPSCFSFSDLEKRPERTEPWDGVRNYQARNFLRDEIAVGDGVLFYHSSITHPAVVGTAVVVRKGYPDTTALDPESDSYDPRSTPETPIWYRVDVRYEKPFVHQVTLEAIKRHPLLAGMELLRRSRLSIQPVTREEWDVILRLGGVVE